MKTKSLVFCHLIVLAGLISCSKETSIEHNNNQQSNSEWEFKEGNHDFKGKVDTVIFNPVSSGIILEINGSTEDGQSGLLLAIAGFDPQKPATYKNSQVSFIYANASTVLYQNNPAIAGDFTITINKIDSSTISGIFSGSATDSAGADKKITEGKFSARYKSPSISVPDSGRVSFWSKNGCNGGNISVKLSNSASGSISVFSPNAPADCSSSGTANFTLAVGTYTWTAYCGTTDSVSGQVTITKGICIQKEVVFASPAVFTLVGSGSNCSNASVQGAYTVGVPLTTANYVDLQVDVTTPGSFAVSTTTVNNISFSGSGSFSSPGVQTITLYGSGQPLTPTATVIPITAGASNCSFSVNVDTLSGGPGAENSWSFADGNKTYQGVFQGPLSAVFEDNPLGFGKVLNLFGTTLTGDTTMNLTVQFAGTATQPVPGTYTTDPNTFSSNTTNFVMYTGTPPSNYNLYYVKCPTCALSGLQHTIVINSYDPSTKIVTGTFSGNAWDKTGAVVNISSGNFNAAVTY